MKGISTQTPSNSTASRHTRNRERATRNECGRTNGLSSLVSFPRRNNRWGDARFRGNCDGGLFKELVHHYRPQRVADPMLGSGTTADVMDDLRYHGLSPARYWGSDLRRGFNLLTDDMPGNFDFIWVHPPYWDIIRYRPDDVRDLSNFGQYGEFIVALTVCLTRCVDAIRPGGRLAVLVGDVRKRGRYYPLAADVAAMAPALGELTSVIIKAQHNCRSDSRVYASMRDLPIKHETCLVFQRPAAGAR